jgi:ribonuclease P protein component
VASKPRLQVLKTRSQFLHLQKNGHRVRPSDWLLLNYVGNSEGRLRCGWTLPRQVGNAVVRNRLKRWARVYFRGRNATDGDLPIDINLVFRKAEGDFYKKLDYAGFESVVEKGWRQLRQRIQTPPPPRDRGV